MQKIATGPTRPYVKPVLRRDAALAAVTATIKNISGKIGSDSID